MRRLLLYCCLIALLFPLMATSPAAGEISESDRALAEQVFHQLLAYVPPPADMAWPPKLGVVDKDEINAFATMRSQEGGQYPVVVCYNGLLKRVVQGNPD